VSGLERVGRLPVFIDEGQWSRAFEAAKRQVDTLYSQGLIDVPTGRVNGSLHRAAIEIATAALRAAAQDDEGDISDVGGVTVSQITNSTAKYPVPICLVPDEEKDLGPDTIHPSDIY